MNPFFKQQLETAQKVNGITFDVLTDWADLLDLSRLADVVTNAESKGDVAILRPCVEIGGILFHRITIGAAHWFQRVAEMYGRDHGEAYSMAFAYAFASARDPIAALWPYADDKRKLEKRLREWQRGLGCTPDELFEDLGEFAKEEQEEPLPGDEAQPEADEKKGTGHGWLVDLLCKEYGGTAEQWIWQTPRSQISTMLAEINIRKRAESGSTRADPNDPRVIASHRFDIRLKALAAKKKAGSNGP